MLQHASIRSGPLLTATDVDDNARALLFSSALRAPAEAQCPNGHGHGLPRSFTRMEPGHPPLSPSMSYDRRWLEPSGSEDSHGARFGVG